MNELDSKIEEKLMGSLIQYNNTAEDYIHTINEELFSDDRLRQLLPILQEMYKWYIFSQTIIFKYR